MFIDVFDGIVYDWFFTMLSNFWGFLLTLDTLVYEDFGLQLGQEFITKAVGNFGIVLYFLFFLLILWGMYKVISFLCSLFFRR